MFTLYADGGHISAHDTKADAIARARQLRAESFEVYDEDDAQVYSERPVPAWA